MPVSTSRLHYQQVLACLLKEFEQRPPEECDYRHLLPALQAHFGCSEEDLLRHGLRKAYRQLVEGV